MDMDMCKDVRVTNEGDRSGWGSGCALGGR